MVEGEGEFGIDGAQGEPAAQRFIQTMAGCFERSDGIEDWLEVQGWLSSFARPDGRGRPSPHGHCRGRRSPHLLVFGLALHQLTDELSDIRGIAGEVEWE